MKRELGVNRKTMSQFCRVTHSSVKSCHSCVAVETIWKWNLRDGYCKSRRATPSMWYRDLFRLRRAKQGEKEVALQCNLIFFFWLRLILLLYNMNQQGLGFGDGHNKKKEEENEVKLAGSTSPLIVMFPGGRIEDGLVNITSMVHYIRRSVCNPNMNQPCP